MAEPTLELTIAQVEVALEEGDFVVARRLVAGARDEYGALPELDVLEARLLEVERLAARPAVDGLVQQAQDLMRVADYGGALAALSRALELQPNDVELQALYGRAEKAAERHSATVEKQQAAASAAAEVATLLHAGDLQTARERLLEARGTYGRQRRFDDLEERLLEQVEAAQRRSSRQHLERAKALLAQEDVHGALHQAELALTLSPGDPAGSELRDEARRRLEELEGAEQRRQALEEIRQDVERLIAAGEMPRADARLAEAVETHGRDPVFDTLADRIDGAKKDQEFRRRIEWRERRAREAEALVQEAQRRALSGDFAAAVQRLETAQELDPSFPEIEEKLLTHRAALERHREAEKRASAMEERVAAISADLDALRLEEAAKALKLGRVRFGAGAAAVEGAAQRFDELEKRLAGLREAEVDILPTPSNLDALSLAVRSSIAARQRTQAEAYAWRQAFTLPFRSGGLVPWLLLAALLAAIHGAAELSGAFDFLAFTLAALVVPAVTLTTLEGKNQLSAGALWRGAESIRGAFLQLGIWLAAALPAVLLLAGRRVHGLFELGPVGWLVLAALLWVGAFVSTVATGVGHAFGGREILSAARWRQGGATALSIAALAFGLVVAALLLRTAVEPALGAPLAALFEAYGLLTVPHLIGVMVRTRRLSWAGG